MFEIMGVKVEDIDSKLSCHHCRMKAKRFRVTYGWDYLNNKRNDWKECYGKRYSVFVAEVCFGCMKNIIAKDGNSKVMKEMVGTPKVQKWDPKPEYLSGMVSPKIMKVIKENPDVRVG